MKQQAENFTMVVPANKHLRSRSRPKARSATDAGHPDLLNALRTCRRQLAEKNDVPVYVIAPNATLEQIAAHLPTTRGAMMTIKGMGSRRFNLYGRQFMDIVRQWNVAARS